MTTNKLAITKRSISTEKLALLYGGAGGSLMIIYFFIINALDLQGSQEARFGSHAFTVLAVFLALRAYIAQSPCPAPYMSGLGLGFLVGLVGSVLFAGFIFVYAHVLNAAYQLELQNQTYFGASVDAYILAATITLLGVVIGSLTGFILMMSQDISAQEKYEASMNSPD
ncbi:MAG: hypothetical protein H7Z21_07060 [Hymenobacter sp.]|nr:hypothetical protein [Hymenobacter sp.]